MKSVKKTIKTKVLLLEDDEDAAFMMCEMLEILNCSVDTAKNVSDALALFKKNSYDFYLIDIIMEGKSGLEALKEMEIDNISRKVIIVSANINSMNMDMARSKGVTRFVSKPVKIDELIKYLT